jgi:hypothetical protein
MARVAGCKTLSLLNQAPLHLLPKSTWQSVQDRFVALTARREFAHVVLDAALYRQLSMVLVHEKQGQDEATQIVAGGLKDAEGVLGPHFGVVQVLVH